MMPDTERVKVQHGWPLVLPNDEGFRPLAGSPDRCFYCGGRIGELHGKTCVTVTKLVEYEVRMDGVCVGTLRVHDPVFWNDYDSEFHKNDSSWCSNNAVNGDLNFTDPEAEKRFHAAANAEDDGPGCACNLVSFKFPRTVDPGPFIEVKKTMRVTEEEQP